jgi:hypothetical protein
VIQLPNIVTALSINDVVDRTAAAGSIGFHVNSGFASKLVSEAEWDL